MEFFNKLANKIGVDKFLHLFLAGWLTQIGGLFGLLGIIIAPIIVMLFGFLKEKYLDNTFDKNDIIANLFGCILATIINVLILIL